MEKETVVAYLSYHCSICLERGGFWLEIRTWGPPEYEASVPVTTPRSSVMCGVAALFKFVSVTGCCSSCEIFRSSDKQIETLSTTIQVVTPPLLPTRYRGLKDILSGFTSESRWRKCSTVPQQLEAVRAFRF